MTRCIPYLQIYGSMLVVLLQDFTCIVIPAILGFTIFTDNPQLAGDLYKQGATVRETPGMEAVMFQHMSFRSQIASVTGITFANDVTALLATLWTMSLLCILLSPRWVVLVWS